MVSCGGLTWPPHILVLVASLPDEPDLKVGALGGAVDGGGLHVLLLRVLTAVVRVGLGRLLGGFHFSLLAAVVAEAFQTNPAVRHRGVNGHGSQEAHADLRLPLRAPEGLGGRGGGGKVVAAEQRLGSQRALDGFIHPGVHLHAALLGVRLSELRRRNGGQAGVHLGQDGLAELQVVEALGGHEAALSLPPAAARGRGGAHRVPIDAVGRKRGQEPLHPGAKKPACLLPRDVYPRDTNWLIDTPGCAALIDLTESA